MRLSDNAIAIYKRLYFMDGETTPEQVHKRIAECTGVLESEEIFNQNKARASSPIMMNLGAGKYNPITSACFIGSLSDDLISILDFDKEAAIIFSYGAGIGGNWGVLREEGAPLSTGGSSSGPISFLKKLDATANTVKSGGRCLAPEQKVFTNYGLKSVKWLVENKKKFVVLSYDFINNTYKTRIAEAFPSGRKDIYKLITNKGTFHITLDHKMFLGDGSTSILGELKPKTKLFGCATYKTDDGYIRVNLKNGKKGKALLHRMIIKDLLGLDNFVTHHINGNKLDNSFSNLLVTDSSIHSYIHNIQLVRNGNHVFLRKKFPKKGQLNGMSRSSGFWKNKKKVEKYKEKQRRILINSGRAQEMQKLSVRSSIRNSIYKLINEGYLEDYPKSFDEIYEARKRYWGKNGDSYDKQLSRIINNFGSFDEFVNDLMENNHSILNYEYLRTDEVYDIEVFCGSEEDIEQNHNFVIFPMDSTEPFGSGILISNCRRAAIMSMMDISHPDIEKFIDCKKDGSLSSMNLSVAVTDKFMQAVMDDKDWELISPLDGKVKKVIPAYELFRKICKSAHETGDPGIFFIDEANEWNPIYEYGEIRATNPCGEITGIARQSCCLASVNIAAHIKYGAVDESDLENTVRIITRFLDSVIDVSGYPTEDYRKIAMETRPIGVGIMGLADALIKLGLQYDSDDGINAASNIQRFVTETVIDESIELAKEKGHVSIWNTHKHTILKFMEFFCTDKILEKARKYGVRNTQWTTIAPTGSISLACDCSSGMEPLFAVCWKKKLTDSDEVLTIVNPLFEQYKNEPWYDKALKQIIKNNGSCRDTCVPEELQRLFVCAHDIHWEDRIEMQAALQRWVTNSISSTVNLPSTATVKDIEEIYMLAWDKSLKGITVYRDGSKQNQPVSFGSVTSAGRPGVLTGETHKIKTGHGNIYVTVNKDCDGKVVEIFTNGGKNGSVSSANLEAIARLMSIALQEGVPLERLTKTILGINDGSHVWTKLDEYDEKPVAVKSIPDAVAKLLKRHYIDNEEMKYDGKCPECGGRLVMEGGCSVCIDCGESKCG